MYFQILLSIWAVVLILIGLLATVRDGFLGPFLFLAGFGLSLSFAYCLTY